MNVCLHHHDVVQLDLYAVAVTWLLLTFNLNTFTVQKTYIYHDKYQQNTLQLISIRKSCWFSSFSSANLLTLISMFTIYFDNVRHKKSWRN
jgi:hypothetical protein